MKIFLIKPFVNIGSIIPSLGLGYLASAVGKSHDIRILDGDILSLTPDKLFQLCLAEHPDLVGIQANSLNLAIISEYLRMIKRAAPGAITVLGGPHPTVCPKETLLSFGSFLDFILQGEAESSFRKLVIRINKEKGLSDLDAFNDIPGIGFVKNGEAKLFPRKDFENLAELYWPAWELIKPECYPTAPFGGFLKQKPAAPIITSRGCPHHCAFCMGQKITGTIQRYRPLDDVMEEIRYLALCRGIKELHLMDDCFTSSREYVLNFSERMAASELGMTWAFPNGVRVKSLDREMLRAMKKGGCYSITLGIEAASDKFLKLIRKGITRDEVVEQVALIKEAGLICNGFFIMGFPGTIKNDLKELFNFALSLRLDRAYFSYFIPLPGSSLYDNIIADPSLGEIKIDSHGFPNIGFVPRGLTERELKTWHHRMYVLYHLQPRVLGKILFSINDFNHARELLRMVRLYLS